MPSLQLTTNVKVSADEVDDVKNLTHIFARKGGGQEAVRTRAFQGELQQALVHNYHSHLSPFPKRQPLATICCYVYYIECHYVSDSNRHQLAAETLAKPEQYISINYTYDEFLTFAGSCEPAFLLTIVRRSSLHMLPSLLTHTLPSSLPRTSTCNPPSLDPG